MKIPHRWSAALLGFALFSLHATATAAPFTAGNIVVYRVGTGTGSLVNTGNPVFLDEYTPAGTLVQSIPLPTTASAPHYQLIQSGTATSGGLLTRSADGRFLFMTGYGRDLGGTGSVTGTASATVPRVVARVDATGAYDTTTALVNHADGDNTRAAVSDNGTNIWLSGNGSGASAGVHYATLGATSSTQISSTVTNLRQINIFNGQLYVSTASGTAVRVGSVGSGLPTTIGQVTSNLPGLTISSTDSPYAFCLLDLNAGVSGVDTLYVADDDNTAPATGGIRKYSLVAGNWVANGSIGATADAYRGLECAVNGGNVVLYGVRKGGSAAAGGGELVTFTDTTGYNATITGTPILLATAVANTAFRGVAFAPVNPPSQPVVNLSVSANSGTEAAQTVITLTATAASAVSGNQTVNVNVGGVNITAGDYQLSSAVITILDGQTAGSVTFTVQNDAVAEGGETAIVSIAGPSSGITLGATTSHNIAIEDDDAQTVTLSVSANSGTEAAQTVITVTATAGANVVGAQTVDVQVSGTNITAGDFLLSAAAITIANGTNTGSVTLTIQNDALAEGTETATLTLANPSAGLVLGSPAAQNIQILDDDVSNTPPTISCAVTAFSGVIADPTNPTFTCTVGDAETAAGSLTVSASSGNTMVVPNANVNAANGAGTVTVTVNPTGVGYSTLTITVTDAVSASAQATVNYAASAASLTPSTSRFHSGIAADASTAIAVDSNYMFVANDENQRIGLYSRTQSGPPIAEFNFTPDQANGAAPLGLNNQSGGVQREVDIEAATKVGSRIYWLASHGNSSSGSLRPNRYRVFSTDVGGSGAASTLTFVGRYDHLRTDLINWDVNNVHGLGVNHFGLQASAASGVIPEDANGAGFNIEGLVMAPGSSTTAYVSFRAPISPASARAKALIVPVTNFATLVDGQTNGGTAGSAVFGAPILLDLGGRGIREIAKNASDQYLIVAGPADVATGTAPKDFRFFTWNGNPATAPLLRSANLTALQTDGSIESIVEVPAVLNDSAVIQVLSDNGDTIFYNDGIIAKELPQNNHKKFRSDTLTLGSGTYRIHTLQGTGTASTFAGQTVTIEGIVTASFQQAAPAGLGGFYVQEEDADQDGDPNTSEAVFVFHTGTAVGPGDKVRVTGTLIEFGTAPNTLTEISPATSVQIVSSGNPLPSFTDLTLPLASYGDWEKYEGMRVRFTQPLTVTENFWLARFGQLTLAPDRLDQVTSVVDPNDDPASGTTSTGASNLAAIQAKISVNKRSQVVLDDASTVQNPATIPFWNGTNNTLRSGSTVNANTVQGIVSQAQGSTTIIGGTPDRERYRVHVTQQPTFNFAPRPTMPPAVGAANVKIGSFNVLNFFNGNGAGGGFPTARGANTLAEFNRQWPKTVAAINGMGADVVGLLEMENDGTGANSAIQDLVNKLNNASAPGTWAFIADPALPGLVWGPPSTNPPANTIYGSADEIKVAIIYKPSVVTPVGAAKTINDPAFSSGRAPVAQTFTLNANGAKFSVIMNHLKSKSAGDNPPVLPDLDADQGDGQGYFNNRRKLQATALVNFINDLKTTAGDDDVMVLGDLNAYEEEDPIDILRAGGMTKISTGYSYVFDAQSGSLDHALGTSSIAAQVTGTGKWHINADEPGILDYNVEFKNTVGCPSGASCTSPDYYDTSAFRSSDHDAVLVGLNLGAMAITHKHFDLNGDGRSDLVWYHSGVYGLIGMHANGLALDPLYAIDVRPSADWQVVGAGDLNGDGRADIVWRNAANGEVYGLLMNGSTVIAQGTIYTEPNLQWKIEQIADLNADGRAELIWKNQASGEVYVMSMNGLAVTGGQVVYAEPNLDWKIVASGDMNGDGAADLLWRNQTTGDVFVMLMNGFTVTGGGVVYSEPNTAWNIVGLGDFNNDGRADILWQNTTTGDVFQMQMNGTTISAGQVIYTEPSTAWKIVALGDYNGDGHADIVWRNDATGQVYMMLMNGFSASSAGFVYAEPDTQWRIVGP